MPTSSPARGRTIDHFPPETLAELVEAGAWFVGDPAIRVYTEAGAEYGVSPEGWVVGGGRVLRGHAKNKILGAVPEERGELFLEVILPGYRMEIHRPTRTMLTTSRVIRWEFDTGDPSGPGPRPISRLSLV